MQKQEYGLTLIEITITLSILGVLFLVANPSLKNTRDKMAIDSIMDQVESAIALAKQTAIMENKIVTFCRSNDGFHCQGKWHQGSIVFTDKNRDREINEDDQLVHYFQPVTVEGTLTFNSFGNRQYVQLTPRGFTNNQSGNFTFCPANRDLSLARQLILNHLGRTRVAQDNDGDGIVENSRGKSLSCD